MSDGELRRLFRRHLPTFDFVSIETGLTAAGVPDLNFCRDGVEGWIECKRSDAWRVRIEAAQVGWAERRLIHGGRVFAAVRRRREELWLYSGWALRPLLSQRLDEVTPLGWWAGGPGRWDWEEVSVLLLSLRGP
jgi:hypothetical protein